MIRIITLNVNGIRAAERKGFLKWAKEQNADVLCVQEIKAQEIHLQDELFALAGYQSHFHYAEKKGYSGVGIYTRHAPQSIKVGLGWEVADQEGRYIEVDFGKVCVASVYLPSGTSGDLRQQVKFDFLERYGEHLKDLQNRGKDFIICGDWNIAHKEIDLKNWRGNRKNSGFLPEERSWMDKLFGELGFVDAFRCVDNNADQYTWWSNRGRARENNVGWRIDYHVTTPGLREKIVSASIYKETFFSDHAPLTIDYDITLD